MIHVSSQIDLGPPFERCCFCNKPTPFWTTLASRTDGQQVACCPVCARGVDEDEVPTKAEWCSNQTRRKEPTK